MTEREALKLALEGAANYIDTLCGDSRKYREVLAQPQRTWVGLTPDETASLWVKAEREDSSWVEFTYKRFARALEDELRKRNT